jgi:tellurite resistance protein TerC
MSTLSRWIFFNIFVLVAVALDLGVLHRRPHRIRLREAAIWSAAWVALSILFGVGVFWFLGRQPALEFFTGYLIEKALSIDNLFLFLVIFRAFSVDERVQHRLLAWGVLGALVMRGIMIAMGAALVARFAWIMYVFGAFLVYAGIHMLLIRTREMHPEQNKIFQLASRHLRVTRQYHGERFFCVLTNNYLLRLYFWCCWWWRLRMSRWRLIPSRRFLASPTMHLSCTPRMCLRFWGCGLFIFCWRAPCGDCVT